MRALLAITCLACCVVVLAYVWAGGAGPVFGYLAGLSQGAGSSLILRKWLYSASA